MRQIKLVFSAVSLLAITGCATSSGVMPIGSDTYSLSVQAATAAAAKQDALNEANAHCKAQNKNIQANYMRPSSDAFGWHSYEVHFKCN